MTDIAVALGRTAEALGMFRAGLDVGVPAGAVVGDLYGDRFSSVADPRAAAEEFGEIIAEHLIFETSLLRFIEETASVSPERVLHYLGVEVPASLRTGGESGQET